MRRILAKIVASRATALRASGQRFKLLRSGPDYLMATALVVIAVLGRWAFSPLLPPSSAPFLFFFPAIVAASWWGRWKAGAWAMVLSGFAAIKIQGAVSSTGQVSFLLFLGVDVLLIVCVELMHVTMDMLLQRDQWFAAAFRASPEGVAITRLSDGTIIEVNDRWLEFYGLQRDETIGARTVDLRIIQPDERERMTQTLRKESKLRDFEVQFRTATGEPRLGVLSAELITVGGESAILSMVRDETERKQAEANVRLARDEALAANRRKDEFIATLSHELRTPLTPVLLAATTNASDSTLSEPVRQTFRTIANHVSFEARLIDDLLDLNQFAWGKIELNRELTDAHALLDEVAADLSQHFDTQHPALVRRLNAADARVMADAERLAKVFRHLLENAFKYTPAHGQVEIETRLVRSGKSVEVAIRDSGSGISERDIARLFEPFMQGENTARHGVARPSGLGLGLAVSKLLVGLHDGEISAASPGANGGTVVLVTLPVAPTSARSSPTPAAAVATDRTPKVTSHEPLVLVVEDHAPTRDAVSTLLRLCGCSPSLAGSLAEARQQLSQARFDLILSDLGLPDGDGSELIAEVRQEKNGATAVAMTGYGTEDDRARTRAAGFALHLVKPISADDIRRAVALIGSPRPV